MTHNTMSKFIPKSRLTNQANSYIWSNMNFDAKNLKVGDTL